MNNISISGYTIHLALLSIFLSIAFYFLNIVKKKYFNFSRYFYYFSFFFITLSLFFLAYHFLTRDFRISYVYSYSSSDLSFLYTISAIWAGQEGSFLIWVFTSALLGLFLMKDLRENENLGMIIYNLQILSLSYLLLRQSPFVTLEEVQIEGKGLNPLLLNPWMAIHPPFIFLGYASYGIPFTVAIVLILKKQFEKFYEKVHKWVIFSWVSMGVGILLGGLWAYETLGWGGFWGWDPVENASLVPWLLMLALIHGLILQKNFKTFYKSNYLLTIFSFFFIFYGTFLTRSGILQDFSVHSFVDLGITNILLIFLFFIIFFGLIIFIFKFKDFPKSEPIERLFSMKAILVYGVILILFSAFFITLGTSSPLITKIFGNPSKVSNDFYLITNIPITILVIIFLGIWPFEKKIMNNKIFYPFLFGAFTTLVSFISNVKNPVHLLIIFFSSFSALRQFLNYKFSRVFFLHSGFLIFIVGSLFSTGYDRIERYKLTKDETFIDGDYEFKFKDFIFPKNNKSFGVIEFKKGKIKKELKPKLWFYERTNQIISNPDILKTVVLDYYFSIEQYNPEERETLVFQKNETKNLGAYRISFKGFQLEEGHSKSNAFKVLCIFELEKAGEKKEIKLIFDPSGIQNKENLEGEIEVFIEGIDATKGKVFLNYKKAQKSNITISFMKIPLINLVWLGSILVLGSGVFLIFKD